MAGKLDWNKIRAEYITTNTSYRILAEKYGTTLPVISDRARREKWRKQREEQAQKALEKAIRKGVTLESKRITRVGEAATKALDIALKAFNDVDQFNRYVVTEGRGMGASETVERIFDKVDTKALRDLAAVIKDLAGVIRNVYNLPTVGEMEARRIAAERLELDKRKAEADSNTDTAIEVTFDAGPEAWNE